MTVIYKSRFFLLAGCVVSSLCFSTALKLSEIPPNSNFKAVSSTGVEPEIQDVNTEASLKNEKFQTALAQLRKNVNIATSDLLAASANN
jgi:hypothetical protein